MRNEEIVQEFLVRNTAFTNNLTSTGDKLFSYQTVIAQWINGTLVINPTKYSSTTSRHLGYVKRLYKGNLTYACPKIPRGTINLKDYSYDKT